MTPVASPRLRRLAQPPPAPARTPPPVEERCDLCNESIGAHHRHLLDLDDRRLLCVCQACRILFEQRAAGGGHLRLVPERRLRLDGFELDDARWSSLRIPVDMAFFFASTPAGRVVALYPGPMGATESQLDLSAWDDVVAANPVLTEMEPDVEALLVHRAGDQFIVPIDRAYGLVGTIRQTWKGLAGGNEVWREIARFFDELSKEAA